MTGVAKVFSCRLLQVPKQTPCPCLSSTVLNSAKATKSWRVLQGQPARQNTFIMLQLLSLRICRTLCYLEWIMARLWVLVQVTSFCHGCYCWGSSAVRWCRVRTSALSMAMVYLVSTNLVCRVLIASDFVLTRLASSKVEGGDWNPPRQTSVLP